MRDSTIETHLATIRAELVRVEAQYAVLVELTANYERWLSMIHADQSVSNSNDRTASEPSGPAAGASAHGGEHEAKYDFTPATRMAATGSAEPALLAANTPQPVGAGR